MRTAEEWIGPDKAKKYLERNISNRPLRQMRVEMYAETMLRGLWKMTYEAIAFDEDGNLLNGQHRLNAVILSGTEQQFFVVRGALRETYDVIDGGAKRSPQDRLAQIGLPYATVAGPALRMLILYGRAPELRWAQMGRGSSPKLLVTDHELLNMALEVGEEAIDEAGRIAKQCSSRAVKMNASAAFAAYLLFRTADPYGEYVGEFFNGLITGADLGHDDPRLTLRQWAARTANGVRGRGQFNLLGFIKAWNAFVEGRPMARLTWRDKEAMPPITKPTDFAAVVAEVLASDLEPVK